MMRTARIKLPPPSPLQAEIEGCSKKRIIVNNGRRAGKTFMASRRSVHRAGKGRRQLYAAPVQAQTDQYWEYCNTWLAPAIAAGLVIRNKQKRTLDFLHSGGRIEARTAHKPDHLRGTWADDLYLDEYAYQDPDVWQLVCSPMLADTGGTAMFISTPNKRNHFYYMYLKAQEDPAWAVFTFPSQANPHLSEDGLQLLAEDMLEVDYRQEVLAEFVPGVGAVFVVDLNDFYYHQDDLAAQAVAHEGHRIVAGLDWGRKQDFTVLSVGCADCMQELWLQRTNQITYHLQREMIKGVLGHFGEVELLAEANSMGLPNIEQLQLDGIDVIPFDTSNASKGILVQGMRLALTQHSWKWLHDEQGMRELEIFEMTISPSGLARYSAPEGLHDDTVMARMLMRHQASTGKLQFY